MIYSKNDVSIMRRAISLASNGLYSTGSNPRVGCVLEKNNHIIAEGWHIQDGDLHAEAMALKQAGENSHGANAWVSLEPCSHTAKQPPCSQALIKAGIKKVFVSIGDPHHLVAGDGIKQLQQANIPVYSGLLADESEKLNIGFYKRIKTGIPWIRLKIALSLDGRIAAYDGSSQWITGTESRTDNMHWRARSQAIVTGASTVIKDDPLMTARGVKGLVNQPHRIVLDSKLRVSPTAKILQNNTTLVSCIKHTSQNYHQHLEHFVCDEKNKMVDLKKLCQWLGYKEYNEVHIEAGAKLSSAFINAGLVDEVLIYQAPILLGDKGIPSFNLQINNISEQQQLKVKNRRQLGRDLRILASL